jgi:hypothetical protein
MPHINLLHFNKKASVSSFTCFFLFITLLSTNATMAQQNNAGIHFQAIARDLALNPVNSRPIYVKATILNKAINGTALFQESHQVNTDKSGVFNIAIGNGRWLDGTFNTINQIDWASGIYFLNLKISITPIAPSSDWNFDKEWIDLGSSVFGVVPYAFNVIGDRNRSIDTSILNTKLSITDTLKMLSPYSKIVSTLTLSNFNEALNKKLNITDSLVLFVTPTQLNSKTFDTVQLSNRINERLKYTDTIMLSNRINDRLMFADTIYMSNRINERLKRSDTIYLSERINDRLKYADTIFLSNRIDERLKRSDTIYLANRINERLIGMDTVFLSNRIDNRLNKRDTVYMADRILLRELLSNKSVNMNLLSDYSDEMYPSVKSAKDYIDNQVSMGAADASSSIKGIIQLTGDLSGSANDPRIVNNAITTNKVLDASITDAKIASGIQASKVGLANVTNHAQLYSLNGLTAQVQDFAIPGSVGLAPNWSSVGSMHTLNMPMANASSVTAGLLSKTEYDKFNTAANANINAITINGNSGMAVLTGQTLNIPNYTIAGLSGLVNPNFVLAGPSSGTAGNTQYRALVSDDIPNNAANTSGNASTSTKLQNSRTINTVAFDGTQDIVIKSTTSNQLDFKTNGLGASGTEYFDGSATKTISYNTVGAAPKIGSIDITTLGTITTGTWSGDVLSASFGGAGNVSGILKANGSGLVTAASSSSDYQLPLSFTSPLSNTSNTISIGQAATNSAGYVSAADWNRFNDKISATEKAVANGIATLNASGKIPTSQIPAISFSSGYVVGSQSAMLSLSDAVVGSIAIRTDISKNYVLSASDPAILNNWLELLMPAAVSSVNGYTTGSIVLTSSDIYEGSNLYYTNARVRTAVDAFLVGEAPISYNSSTGKISITPSSTNVNGYLSSTDWNTFNNKMSPFGSQTANTFYAAPNGIAGVPSFRTLLAADIPTLNQSTTGNAATSTALLNARNINGVSFNGTADITIPSNTSNGITFNNSGTGAASATSFNGSSPIIISYNSIGALPIVGANTITTLGTISSGTWNANVIGSNYGGAGTINGLMKANGSGVVAAAIAGTDFESPLSFTSPLIRSSNAISIQTATTSNSGILSSSDWQLFNNKQTTISAGAGVTISGGNTINIGQAVAASSSPIFTGITLSDLKVSGMVANSAAGILSSVGVTGTGLVVKENSPTLVTPELGVATARSINTGTITATSTIASIGDITAKRFILTMPTSIVAASTTNVDLSLGNIFTVTLSANITSLTFTNAAVGTYLIKFVQDVTGGRTVSFPAAWKWSGGIVPTVTVTPSKLDIVTLVHDGTTYYATIVKNF